MLTGDVLHRADLIIHHPGQKRNDRIQRAAGHEIVRRRVGNRSAFVIRGGEAIRVIQLLCGIEDDAHAIKQLVCKVCILCNAVTKHLSRSVHIQALTGHTVLVGLIANEVALAAIDMRLLSIEGHGRPLHHSGIVVREIIIDRDSHAAQQIIESPDAGDIHGDIPVHLRTVILPCNAQEVLYCPDGVAVVGLLRITVGMGKTDLQPAGAVVSAELAVELHVRHRVTVELKLTDLLFVMINRQEQQEVRLAALVEAVLSILQRAIVHVVIADQQHRGQTSGGPSLIGHAVILAGRHEGGSKSAVHPQFCQVHTAGKECTADKNEQNHRRQADSQFTQHQKHNSNTGLGIATMYYTSFIGMMSTLQECWIKIFLPVILGKGTFMSGGIKVQWLWIIAGILLLIVGWSVTFFLRRGSRLRLSAEALRCIRRASRLHASTPDVQALHDAARMLTEHLMRIRQQLRRAPILPADDEGNPRLMDLAHDLTDDGVFTAEAMQQALSDWGHTASPGEVEALPLCVAAAQGRRLERVLHAVLADAKARTSAARLLRRMLRSKQPASLLNKAALPTIGLAEFMKLSRSHDPDRILIIAEEWLAEHSLTAEALTQHALSRQMQLAEEIRRAANCFSALTRLDWLSHSSESDALHPLLEADPAGVYPRMDASSQLKMRRQAEALARYARLSPEEVVRQALILADEAENASIERSLCFWLQDAEGLRRLMRTLPSRKGRLLVRFFLPREQLKYAFLWGFGILTGFLFLQGRGPVFMLPFFALVSGCTSRWIIRRFPHNTLPRLTLSGDVSQLRTLVVMPVVLHDAHEAIRMVRRLKTVTHAFPQDVDFLLLGDHAPAITPASSGDQGIIHAAASAVAALEDERVMYLHRARTWDSAQHCYAPRAGKLGALTGICRLIAQGECEDVIAFATVEAARFERQYAYVLSLPPDCQPAPGMFEALLGTMAHPLCGRSPEANGWRGYSILSPEKHALFDGVGLIRPDAFLEATDGLLPPQADVYALCGELAGHAAVPGAHVRVAAVTDSSNAHYAAAKRAWRLLPWQLPLVQTPSGIVNNPLPRMARFRLREQLRTALIPLGQCALLLYAVLTQSWALLLLALLPLVIGHPLRRWQDWIHLACRLSLLPASLAVPLRALFDLLRRRSSEPAWVTMEIWAQGIAATVMTALGLALPGFSLPALALGVLFGCFPLAHRCLEAPLAQAKGITEQQVALLERIAASTWNFFQTSMTEANRHLPPASVQFEPGIGADTTVSPEGIAAALLASICAKDLGFLSANTAAERISDIADALDALPLPCGLPCRRYALPSLTAVDARVDARSCGFLLCALMTAAQALRTWLPELSPDHFALSARMDAIASSLEIKRLYDAHSGLFHEGLDEDGQPFGFVDVYADEGLLLSIAARAAGIIPPDHFARLSRTQTRCHGIEIPLSVHGTAAEHLLPGLFVPTDSSSVSDFIRAMISAGKENLFGQDECGCFQFDPTLRYHRRTFGLQDTALLPVDPAPVYAPYAAALCLLHIPRQAAEALQRFEALGALGPDGFCDAVDFTQGAALVGMQNAYHQGIILMAAAHLLADAPVRRYFCSLPQVEACLPLLDAAHPPLVIPQLPHQPPIPGEEDSASDYTAEAACYPPEATVLGNADFHLIADAAGNSAIYSSNIPLTRCAAAEPCGIQFYLSDEGRICRLGSPALDGTASFAQGELRFEQVFGSLRAELVCTVDTVRKRTLHIVTITNLSTRDRLIDLADCLIPNLGVPNSTLEVDQPEKARLCLRARGTDTALYHAAESITPPLSQSVCTDAAAFLGRGRTLHAPASLEEPPHDQFVSSADPCLSFRLRFSLGGRGQVTVWFTTGLTDAPPPLLKELTGIRRLAALQHSAIGAAAPLTPMQARITHRLLAPLWAAEGRVSLLLCGHPLPEFLSDLSAILQRLQLQGVKTKLSAAGQEDAHEALSELLPVPVKFCSSGDLPVCPLTLRSDLPLAVQVDALHAAIPSTIPAHKPPLPALLPERELTHACPYGGFDPETSDYLLQLEPRQTTPVPWTNRHISRRFTETVDESGFRTPFEEQVWLQQQDGTLLSPWSPELPRAVRMGLGETSWETWSDTLDVRLTAACVPGHTCALRVLRIRNASDRPQTVTITVLAQLSDRSALDCAPGLVTAIDPAGLRQPFIAGDGWRARRAMLSQFEGQPLTDLPDDPQGHYALLQVDMPLAPHASGKAIWLAGFARHSEDIARALASIHESGTSDILRSVRSDWAQKLALLTFSTPEDTLDLLMNRLLPAQGLAADTSLSALVGMYLSPAQARRALLRAARNARSRDEFAHLSLLLEKYFRITGDENLVHVYLPSQDAALYDACAHSLLTLPLDRSGLPMGEDQAHRCFLYAAAAQALHHIRPSEELHEWSRKLLMAADTHLWQDGFYGDALRLDVQSLAALALGETPRTRQAMQTCWNVLYDRPHGLIKAQESTDMQTLPGLPENGGMRTADAALCLHALLKTGCHDEAFELLRALNPLHHADDSLRMETFQCAPYLLHGGMCASPMKGGRAVYEGGGIAACVLYAVVLEDIIGLRRKEQIIHLEPCVPPDWEDFTLSLREGASTWRISAERRIDTLTIDGEEVDGESFTLVDDGRVHRVRFPLK